MRATQLRDRDGLKFEKFELENLCEMILAKMKKAGFITGAEVLTSTSIKIGMHMSSFRIDTAKLGHNARTNRWIESPKGYKRTNVPTWDQRVKFNNIVNDCLDSFGASGRIVSGAFTVRHKRRGRVNHWYPGGDLGTNAYSAHASEEILQEAEMREQLDSDRLEAEHAEKMKPIRQEQAKAARMKRKELEAAKMIFVVFQTWGSKKDKRDGVYSQKRFRNLKAKLQRYELRRMTARPFLGENVIPLRGAK